MACGHGLWHRMTEKAWTTGWELKAGQFSVPLSQLLQMAVVSVAAITHSPCGQVGGDFCLGLCAVCPTSWTSLSVPLGLC